MTSLQNYNLKKHNLNVTELSINPEEEIKVTPLVAARKNSRGDFIRTQRNRSYND
jgi:hypothetical protein